MAISRRRFAVWLAAAAFVLPLLAEAEPRPPLTVFAAASLTDALKTAGDAYAKRTGQRVRFSFSASGTAARQIEAGAGADLFVSAEPAWMDEVQRRGLVQRGGRKDLLSGRLALIAPVASRIRLSIRPGFPLAAALGPRGRLALGDPRVVPAGRYARVALTRLGVWSSLAARLVPAQDVRGALAYVARGEAPLGVVYQTDALADQSVKVVGLFPAGSHPPIIYPAAVLRGARAGSADFYRFLSGGEARAIFTRYGFRPIG